MPEKEELLKALSECNDVNTFYNNDNEHDLGEVLKCDNEKITKHKLRMADGTERILNFD